MLGRLTGHKRVTKIIFALSIIFDIFPFEVSSTSTKSRLACNSICDELEELPTAFLADRLQKIHFVGMFDVKIEFVDDAQLWASCKILAPLEIYPASKSNAERKHQNQLLQ